jgi:hypothetical protein
MSDELRVQGSIRHSSFFRAQLEGVLLKAGWSLS